MGKRNWKVVAGQACAESLGGMEEQCISFDIQLTCLIIETVLFVLLCKVWNKQAIQIKIPSILIKIYQTNKFHCNSDQQIWILSVFDVNDLVPSCSSDITTSVFRLKHFQINQLTRFTEVGNPWVERPGSDIVIQLGWFQVKATQLSRQFCDYLPISQRQGSTSEAKIYYKCKSPNTWAQRVCTCFATLKQRLVVMDDCVLVAILSKQFILGSHRHSQLPGMTVIFSEYCF